MVVQPSHEFMADDGNLEPWNFICFHILGIIISTDELVFFPRGRSTTNQMAGLKPSKTMVESQQPMGK